MSEPSATPPEEARITDPRPVPFWAHLAPFLAYFLVTHLLGDPAPWKAGLGAAAALALFFWQKPWRDDAIWAHLAPYALWLSLMTGLGEPAAWKYAVRAAAGVAALLWLRPWRFYERPSLKNLPLALGAGVVVFIAWVGMETPYVVQSWSTLATDYQKYLVMPFGELRPAEAFTQSPYDPAACGWPLTLARLLGSAFVIPIAEEVLWRGFLFRWLTSRNFLTADLGKVDMVTFWLIAICFGGIHHEWAAGIFAGAVFGWLYLRTKDLWAAIFAHMLTNLLLGIYVLKYAAWQFW